MDYYFETTVAVDFNEALRLVTEALRQEGFGVITEIDVKATLKAKLGVDFRKYHILGACNPTLAYEALQLEDKIGVMLPCNVIVQERGDGRVEIAAIDPVASMLSVDNPELKGAAAIVRAKLKKVVETL